MKPDPKPIVILMADDDEDDCLLTKKALESSRVINELRIVHDGVELIDYLRGTGKYTDPASRPRPGFILLDLNMPRMDGREALAVIKEDPELRRIPVVVMTTSRAEEDVMKSYDLGAAGYVTKPVTFQGLVEAMKLLGNYWIGFVQLPG